MKITLASGSPRRAKILKELGVDFEVVKTDAPETSYPDDPERTVRENALAKGAACRARLGDAVRGILSADTIVWYGGRIYGKPRDLAEAKAFLRELSGRTHVVFTGVAYDGDVRVVRSDVTFRDLSDAEIDDYVAAVKPTDRAGAYDIDESGDRIVAGWTGSYENIMGLPVEPLVAWGLAAPRRKKVFVSGCYDLLHSGHVAFFEEASRLGDLYVGLGSDRNIRELKRRETVNRDAERLYMVRAIRFVKDAWVNSGMGKMDFVREVEALKPDIFFVNRDGWSEEKEAFCRARGIRLVVADRIPAAGLPVRSTTALRAGLGLDGAPSPNTAAENLVK